MLVLRRIDNARTSVDPEQLEVLHIRRDQPLEDVLEEQNLELERLALVVDADAVLDSPSRFVEELAGLDQEVAVLARAVALGRHVSCSERLVGNGHTEICEQRALGV